MRLSHFSRPIDHKNILCSNRHINARHIKAAITENIVCKNISETTHDIKIILVAIPMF